MKSAPGFYPTINIPYHKWLHLPRNTSLHSPTDIDPTSWTGCCTWMSV